MSGRNAQPSRYFARCAVHALPKRHREGKAPGSGTRRGLSDPCGGIGGECKGPPLQALSGPVMTRPPGKPLEPIFFSLHAPDLRLSGVRECYGKFAATVA